MTKASQKDLLIFRFENSDGRGCFTANAVDKATTKAYPEAEDGEYRNPYRHPGPFRDVILRKKILKKPYTINDKYINWSYGFHKLDMVRQWFDDAPILEALFDYTALVIFKPRNSRTLRTGKYQCVFDKSQSVIEGVITSYENFLIYEKTAVLEGIDSYKNVFNVQTVPAPDQL